MRVYRISSRGQPIRGEPSNFGVGRGATTTPHRKNLNMLRILQRYLGTGLILSYDLREDYLRRSFVLCTLHQISFG
jgi:hypothetical protein